MTDKRAQEDAVIARDLLRLRSMVDIDGPLLTIGDIGPISDELMDQPDLKEHEDDDGAALDILRYLITDYGLDVNATYLPHPEASQPENLLICACNAFNPYAVSMLLGEGADPECPGLAVTALEHVKAKLRNQHLTVDRLSHDYMSVINSLMHYGGGPDVQTNKPKNLRSCSKIEMPLHFRDGRKDEYFNPHFRRGPRTLSDSSSSSDDDDWVDVQTETWVDESKPSFEYKPLSGQRTIRLLELEPSGSPADPIRCKMLHRPLFELPRFEFLSLDVHSSEKTAFILMDGGTLEIPIEAWRALQAVRLQNKPRILWTEAISINPHSVGEPLQQLYLLTEICQQSSGLLAYLGESADGSDLVFDHLDECAHQDKLNWPHYPPGDTRQAFLRLCTRPWFFRARSIPEIAGSARNPIHVLCGKGRRAELKRLAFTSSFLPPDLSYHPLLGVHLPSHLRHLVHISQGNPSTHVDCILAVRACRSTPFAPSSPGYFLKLAETILCYLSANVHTGMNTSPLPEYISTATAVLNKGGDATTAAFQLLTRHLMEQMDDYSALHWLPPLYGPENGDSKKRSSWTLIKPEAGDLFSPYRPVPFPRTVGSWIHSSTCLTKISSDYKSPHSTQDNRIVGHGRSNQLCIGGVRPLDTIAHISDQTLDFDMLPGNDGWKQVLQAWETLLIRELGPCTNAFADTLRAREGHGTLSLGPGTDGCVASGWYARFGGGVLPKEDAEFFEGVQSLAAWLDEIKVKGEKEYYDNPEKWSAYAAQMETACYGRRFFISESRSMGLAPAGARDGDELVFAPGARYPLVMRKKKEKEKEEEEEDEDDDSYWLLGDCFLHNFDINKFE